MIEIEDADLQFYASIIPILDIDVLHYRQLLGNIFRNNIAAANQANMRRAAKVGQRLIFYFVEDVRLATYFVVFPLVIAIFGLAYWLLTPFSNGLVWDLDTPQIVSVFDAMYFSVVTVASLGYGDIRPVGASRVLACLEVLFGLAFLGIIVAKVTSQRLSHHVRRLFSSDAQKRLNDFTRSFERSNRRLNGSMKALGTAYQPTPDQIGDRVKEKTEAQSSFRAAIKVFRQASRDLDDYFESETQQSGYFDIVPTNSIERLGETIDKGMMILTQLIISLSPEAKTEVLDTSSRQGISDILAGHQRICAMFAQYCKDTTLRQCFDRIRETCDHLPENYYVVPRLPAAEEQPDQLPERADQPELPERQQ